MNLEKVNNLVELSKQGDTVAFRRLIETCQSFVFRLAFRLLCSNDEAKDVVQETFIRVWLNLNKYKNDARFSTWLYKIACNLCYDRLRAMKRSQTVSIDLSELDLADGNYIEKAFINRNLIEWITILTNELTPKQRLVFTLRDIEEMELDEIKKITGMSGEKIKSNLYLARQYIRERIKNE